MILQAVGIILWGLMLLWAMVGLAQGLAPVKDHLRRMMSRMAAQDDFSRAPLWPARPEPRHSLPKLTALACTSNGKTRLPAFAEKIFISG